MTRHAANIRSWDRRNFLNAMSADALADPGRWRTAGSLRGGEPFKHPRTDRRHDASCSGWPAEWRRPKLLTPSGITPYEVGVPVGEDTMYLPRDRDFGLMDNVKISPRAWSTSRRCSNGVRLIRSHIVADLGNILHSRHQYHWHTGYVPPQTVACSPPGFAWVAKVRGPRNPGDPGVHQYRPAVGGAMARSEELKAFTTAGFFGSEFGPFNIPFRSTRLQPPCGHPRG